MRSIKTSALAIATALAAAEAAVANGDPDASDKLNVLHKELRAGLFNHREDLGLSDEDVMDIDTHGEANFGGTPKGPPPGDDEEDEGGG